MAEYGVTSMQPYARAMSYYREPAAGIQIVNPQPAPRAPSVWDSYRQVLAPPSEPLTHVQSAVTGVRYSLEGAAIGALLGVIHGKFGTLDIAGKYPADGIAAALLLMLSVQGAGKPDGFASDLRAMSQSCTTVAFFRKTSEWAAGPAKIDSAPIMSRHNGVDPLVAAAQKHGL